MNMTNRFDPEANPMLTVDLKEQFTDILPFDDTVSGLVTHFKELWWNCKPTLPDLGPAYDPKQKNTCKSKLVNCLDQLGEELMWISRNRPDRRVIQDRLFPLAGNFLMTTFGLEDRHVLALTS